MVLGARSSVVVAKMLLGTHNTIIIIIIIIIIIVNNRLRLRVGIHATPRRRRRQYVLDPAGHNTEHGR